MPLQGRVSSVSQEPAPDLTVRLVEQLFRNERVLAEGKTGADGRYELAFAHEKSNLPVLVRVIDGDAVAAESTPQVMTSPLLEVDLNVAITYLHSPSEYQRIVSDVLARTGQIDLGTLRHDDQEDDIAFLSNGGEFIRDLHYAVNLTVGLQNLQPLAAGPSFIFDIGSHKGDGFYAHPTLIGLLNRLETNIVSATLPSQLAARTGPGSTDSSGTGYFGAPLSSNHPPVSARPAGRVERGIPLRIAVATRAGFRLLPLPRRSG